MRLELVGRGKRAKEGVEAEGAGICGGRSLGSSNG